MPNSCELIWMQTRTNSKFLTQSILLALIWQPRNCWKTTFSAEIPLANMRQNGPLFLKKMMMQNPIGIPRLKLVEWSVPSLTSFLILSSRFLFRTSDTISAMTIRSCTPELIVWHNPISILSTIIAVEKKALYLAKWRIMPSVLELYLIQIPVG